jgi:hypothetical protein
VGRGEKEQVPWGEITQSLLALCEDRGFPYEWDGNLWGGLSRGGSQSDLGFNRIALATVRKQTRGKQKDQLEGQCRNPSRRQGKAGEEGAGKVLMAWMWLRERGCNDDLKPWAYVLSTCHDGAVYFLRD